MYAAPKDSCRSWRCCLSAALAVLLFFATTWASCCALACEWRHVGGSEFIACVEELANHASQDAGATSTAATHAGPGCHLIGVGLVRSRLALALEPMDAAQFPELESRFVSHKPDPLERPPRRGPPAVRA